MKATRRLHDLGQSLWLDNITRGIPNGGSFRTPRGKVRDAGAAESPHRGEAMTANGAAPAQTFCECREWTFQHLVATVRLVLASTRPPEPGGA